MSVTKYCTKHPKTETNLQCSRCEEPVCPRCMVQGPVGVRCPKCAHVRPLPTFEVTGVYMARGIVASLVLGAVAGVAFLFLSPLLYSVVFLDVVAMAGVGYLVGGGTSAAVNRKRGRSLKFVAAAGVLLATFIMAPVVVVHFSLFALVGSFLAFYIAINRF